MRHLSNRSTSYVVIGIGLLILTVAQLRRGNEASNASFVANSSPFEALKDYQPSAPFAEVVQDQADNMGAQLVSEATTARENIESTFPVEFPVDSMESAVDVAANFVNIPNSTEMPAVVADDEVLHYDLGFGDAESSGDSEGIDNLEEPLPPSNDETLASETPLTESPNVAIFEPIELQQQASELTEQVSTAIAERVSTDMPAFSSLGENDQRQVIKNPLASPAAETKDTNTPNSAWKKNPFLTDAPLSLPTKKEASDAAISADLIPPRVDAMMLSETTDASEDLSVIADIEPASVPAVQTILPSVDHETMQSVIAEEENLEASSPSIRIGISQSDAQKAVHNIEYGKSLSRRGAAYAARQEFYASLRILAQSHDRQADGTVYTNALRNGILAIKEAQDFIVTDTESQIGLSVSNVIETHSTKIISAESAQGMTAIEAAQRYFAYASHQLSRCGGQNVVSAEALYCLGKLHSVQAKSGSNDSKLDLAKSMIYHQAAISADDSNFRSLNELGVLYANSGRFEEAKHMLKRSLRIKQLPQAWQNLSVIHQRMGEHQLAQLANREFEMSSAQAPISVIQWTPVEEFNKNAPLAQHKVTQASALLPTSEDTKSATSTLKSLGGRILDSIR